MTQNFVNCCQHMITVCLICFIRTLPYSCSTGNQVQVRYQLLYVVHIEDELRKYVFIQICTGGRL